MKLSTLMRTVLRSYSSHRYDQAVVDVAMDAVDPRAELIKLVLQVAPPTPCNGLQARSFAHNCTCSTVGHSA